MVYMREFPSLPIFPPLSIDVVQGGYKPVLLGDECICFDIKKSWMVIFPEIHLFCSLSDICA